MELKDIMSFGVSQEISKKIYEKFKQKLSQIEKKHQLELQQIRIKSLVETELLLNGARNIKSVLPLINLDELEIQEDNLSDIKQKIKELKEDPQTNFLFFQPEEQNKNLMFKGMTPFESKFKKTHKLDDMDYEQLCYYYDNFTNL